jgi:hypothetical protein
LDELVRKQLPAELQHYPNSVFLPTVKRNTGSTVYLKTSGRFGEMGIMVAHTLNV